MADESKKKPEIKLTDAPPDPPRPKRLLPKRSFKFDEEAMVGYLDTGLTQDEDARDERMGRRAERRLKLMGWLPYKDFPWPNASNFWVGLMLISGLKMRGVMENSLKALRPMLNAKARQQRNTDKEKKIDNVLDYQFFIENKGETIIDTGCANFWEDEAVYAEVQYVKETQTFHDTRIFPPLKLDASVEEQLLTILIEIFGQEQTQRATDNDFYEWEVSYLNEQKEPVTATCCFYEMDDSKIQACIVKPVTTFDGPLIRILNFEDVVFPARSANLQPPSGTNPDGATYVNVLFNFNADTARRRMLDGTYGLMTEDKIDLIANSKSDVASGSKSDEPKEQKDQQEGVETTGTNGREDRQGVRSYCRWDINGDGLDEDIIVWWARKSKVVMDVKILTEVYPITPITRPLVHDSYIPIQDRVVGMSGAESLESLQDCMQIMLDQHVDYGTLTNTPFFFYRAASGMKGEPISIEPGMGFPLDNPTNDVMFPTWPTKDSGFALNTMAVLSQMAEDMRGFSAMAVSGRVPTGKASALRTMGTTNALLQQSDERSEQVLRRLFHFLANIFQLMHGLNRRYLPDNKEIRAVGMAEAGGDAYITVDSNRELDADVDFDFKATIFNSNKQMMAQAIKEVMALTISPLAMMLGIVTPKGVYELFKREYEAYELDPDDFLQRPVDPMPGPKRSAEDIISILIANEPLIGAPLEPPQEHLMKLQTWMNTGQMTLFGVPIPDAPQLGVLTSAQSALLGQWMAKVAMLIQQQQMMMQAAGDFQKQAGGGGGEEKPGGVQSQGQAPGIGDNAMVGKNEMVDESMAPGGLPQ
jgi:hypothetical protein